MNRLSLVSLACLGVSAAACGIDGTSSDALGQQEASVSNVCAFGATESDIRESRNLVSNQEQYWMHGGAFVDGTADEALDFIPANVEISWTQTKQLIRMLQMNGAPSDMQDLESPLGPLGAALSWGEDHASSGYVVYRRLLDVNSGAEFDSYDFDPGDNGYGAVFYADSLEVAAEIGDSDLYKCTYNGDLKAVAGCVDDRGLEILSGERGLSSDGCNWGTCHNGRITGTTKMYCGPKAAELGYFDEVTTEFGNSINYADGKFTKLADTNSANYVARIRQLVGDDKADAMEFTEVKTQKKFVGLVDNLLKDASDHAASAFDLATRNGAKVYWLESFGEDGIWLIYGFVLVDDVQNASLVFISETSA